MNSITRSLVRSAAFASLLAATISHAAVGDLYAVTGAGSAGCGGGNLSSLYKLDPDNGSATLIAPVMIGATQARHMTGLAMHPQTGVLYGLMNGQDTGGDDCYQSTLLTIDPATGEATIVGTQGSMQGPIPDITFDAFGTLYAWDEGFGDQLAVIDITDGTISQVGVNNLVTQATGIASDSKGRLWLKSQSYLTRLNQYTGFDFNGLFIDHVAHNTLAFSGGGSLYSGERTQTGFTLFTINTETGATAEAGSNTVKFISAIEFDRGVVTPPDVADLSLTKEVDDSSPVRGSDVVFTLTLTNDGPDAADNVVVRDLLPSAFTFISATGDGSYDDATGEWTLASVADSASATIEITATASDDGPFSNAAEVWQSDSYDPDSVPQSGEGDTYAEVEGQVLLPTLFSIDRDEPRLWAIDPFFGIDEAAQTLELENHDVCGGNGLAVQPETDTLFGVLAIDGCNERTLVTIDPVTADATEIGSFNDVRIASIAFGADDNTLYGASGNNGSQQRTLFTIDPTDGTLTPECILEGDTGRALAFVEGLIYDASYDCTGDCQVVIRLIDPQSFPSDPSETCTASQTIPTGIFSEPTSMTLKEIGVSTVSLYLASFSTLYEVIIPGDSSPADAFTARFLSHDSKGLALTAAPITVGTLGISKSVIKSRVKGTKYLDYSLQPQNSGPDNIDNVVVTDPIPAGTIFVSADPGCSEIGGNVVCEVGELGAGSTLFYSVRFQVICKKCSTISNTVFIDYDSDAYDNPFNNEWTIDTSVKGGKF